MARATMIWRTGLLLSLWCLSGAVTGCAATPYRFGRFHEQAPEAPREIVFEYGQPNRFLDGMAWVTAIPSRVLVVSHEMNTHSLSEETTDQLREYLQANDLDDVLVRVNQYDPRGEFQRLCHNQRVGIGWRSTVGVLGLTVYTLFPGRVFGGDHYNPYTNTLYVNSDVPALLIVESAYAKDLHARRLPGTYAVLNEIPLVSLWRYTNCVNDALGYARLHDDWETEHELYRKVYPVIGVQSGLGGHTLASAMTAMPMLIAPLSAVGGALAGHAVGQSTIAYHERLHADNPGDDEVIERLATDSDEILPARYVRDDDAGHAILGDR